jgi:serine/threonine protein kinase
VRVAQRGYRGTPRALAHAVGFTPGDRIGNYRIELELGPTGWGHLVQGAHLVLPRRANIKIVQASFAADPRLVIRTLREACILEAVNHPGVPMVYDAGLVDDRWPWFAFEVVDGLTLDDVLTSGPLPVIEVAALVRDLSDVLEHAHHRGVIHRALRPNRIVITAARRYPLCIPDWSEAIVHDAISPAPLVVSEASRSYVAPELLRRDDGPAPPTDGRADVFALGVIAHRALTGGLPVARGLGTEPFAPSHERCLDAPRGLTALIDSMLAFDRLDRPNASELRAEVDWLFATVDQLKVPVGQPAKAARSAPGLPVPLLSPDELVTLAERQRVRRPRWTPELRYVETGDAGDRAITGDDAAD